MINLLIGMPTWQGGHWINTLSLFTLAATIGSLGCENATLMIIPRRNTVDARQLIYEHFLKNKQYTHLLSLDDDVGFEFDDFKKLLEDDKEFVSGILRWRRKPHLVTAHKDGKVLVFNEIKHKGLIQIDSCGLGFALIKRSVADKIGEYNFYRKIGGEQDVNFTRYLRESGIELWLDTDVIVKHVGEVIIQEEINIV